MKACKICGEMFEPEKNAQRICKNDHHTSCPICGKDIIWNSTRLVEPCCKECKKESTRKMYLEKYGVDHPMKSKEVQQHHKQVMLDKYGVESPLQSEEIKQRAIQSNRQKFGADWALGNKEFYQQSRGGMVEKYGVEYNLQRLEVLDCAIQKSKSRASSEKRKSTLLYRYGQDCYLKTDEARNRLQTYWIEHQCEIKEKINNTLKSKYGVTNPMEVPEFVNKIAETMMERYGVRSPIHVPAFRDKMDKTCLERYGLPFFSVEPSENSASRISKNNISFVDKLSQVGVRADYEFRIDTKWYDIKLSQSNTVIEIDPTYTHNSFGNHWEPDGVPEDYHIAKTKLAKDNGYRCIHVFDWDDVDKVVNLLRPKQKIYARKCKIYILNKKATDTFLNENHIQGTCKGQLISLGLIYNDEIVQVMTFGKPRYSKSHDSELLRLCSKSGVTVVGGASKLLSFAKKAYSLGKMISYCDLSKFTGDVYAKLGMTLIRTTQPQEIWSKGSKKITANLLRQRGYDQLFGTSYGKGSDNNKLMLKNGWLPVYDCGQAVYEIDTNQN